MKTLTKLLKIWTLAAAVLVSASTAACGGGMYELEADEIADEDGDESYLLPFEEIANIQQTVVKRQSIGNCWLYATATWAESMHLLATGDAKNVSESYWTYWHWFEEISNGEAGDEIQTGGSWDVSKMIIARYGVIEEKDFIPEEANAEMSQRQDQALKAINASLKSGVLKDRAARRNRAVVRAELDKAWRLSETVTKQLTKIFKADVSQHLATRKSNGRYAASTTGTKIKRATAFKVKYSSKPGLKPSNKTLAKAIVDWREVGYWASSYSSTRRNFEKRFQQALHDGNPVIISWFVDFNALDSQGAFRRPPATPGNQGGHMTVIDDYQVNNVPGYGTLAVGKNETRKAALKAALADEAEIEFLRVKNSWGGFRPDRAFVTAGYHDLYSDYLYGKVKRCAEGSRNCFDYTPMQDVVLPPGY